MPSRSPTHHFSPFQIAVHIGAWLPLVYLIWAYATNNLTFNPIQAATQRTGFTALVLLVLALACTPANTVFKFKPALKVRRALGLYAFMYAAIHVFLFAGVDYQFNLKFILMDTGKKPYIWVGLTTGIILLLLAATSFQWSMKRLGKNWKRLHKLVYLAGVLDVLHFAWARKANIFTLTGDVWQPLLFVVLVGVLLLVRVPVVRQRLAALRS
jgi:sulfoxide reductase heme-binding subunit YedZ